MHDWNLTDCKAAHDRGVEVERKAVLALIDDLLDGDYEGSAHDALSHVYCCVQDGLHRG